MCESLLAALPAPDAPSEQRSWQQPGQGSAVALQLFPVPPRAGYVAGHESHGIADGGGHRGIPQGNQNGERHQGAGTDDRVDGSAVSSETKTFNFELSTLNVEVRNGRALKVGS